MRGKPSWPRLKLRKSDWPKSKLLERRLSEKRRRLKSKLVLKLRERQQKRRLKGKRNWPKKRKRKECKSKMPKKLLKPSTPLETSRLLKVLKELP